MSANAGGYKIGLSRFMTLIAGQVPGVKSVGFIPWPDSEEETDKLERTLRSGNCSYHLLRGRLFGQKHLSFYYILHHIHESVLLSRNNCGPKEVVVHAAVVAPEPLHLRFRLLQRNSGKLLGEKEFRLTSNNDRIHIYSSSRGRDFTAPIVEEFADDGDWKDDIVPIMMTKVWKTVLHEHHVFYRDRFTAEQLCHIYPAIADLAESAQGVGMGPWGARGAMYAELSSLAEENYDWAFGEGLK